jgi:hypothetical protein
MTVLDVVAYRIEEALMSGRFGERYQVYMQHTGRLFPRFGFSGIGLYQHRLQLMKRFDQVLLVSFA